jgi:hypothetical protein
MINQANNQLSAECNSFDAFAFLYGKRFCLHPIDYRDSISDMFDNFDYEQNNLNMPFEGKLRPNEIHVVTVNADLKDNYTLSAAIMTISVKGLNRRIGYGQIKEVLSECYDKYREQRFKDSLKKFEEELPF